MFLNIDWYSTLTHIVAAAVPFTVVLVLKFLLDAKLAQRLVVWLSWLPLRSILRENPHSIAGQWEHEWGAAGSTAFADVRDRHSHPTIRQLGPYCYAEVQSQKKTYAFFGRIKGDYWTGEWYDKNDLHGYFGVFEIRILDSGRMDGQYLGHSKTEFVIRCGPTQWVRC